MKLHVKMIVTTFSFLLITGVVVILLTLRSSYRYNDVSVTGAGVLEEALLNQLSLDDEYYIFTTNMTLNNRLEEISYLSSYSFEKAMPNHIDLVVETVGPILCDENYLYFSSDQVQRTDATAGLCTEVTVLDNRADDVNKLLFEFSNLKQETKDEITKVQMLSSEELIVTTKKHTVLVYTEDIEWLNQYSRFDPEVDTIDLRKNYG